jgi:alpha-L-fucosidase
VRAYVDSFRSLGLKTCLYFSILDLRGDIRPYCVTREKIDRVKAQLTELLIFPNFPNSLRARAPLASDGGM